MKAELLPRNIVTLKLFLGQQATVAFHVIVFRLEAKQLRDRLNTNATKEQVAWS